MEIRIGNGFDVHALKKGKEITLCGVKLQHDYSLVGHSDADVALHALTDAIFGALAEGDIGHWFPPSEKKCEGVNSEVFLKKSIEIMKERQFYLSNIDLTLICEKPKIKSYAFSMRTNLSELCKLKLDRVSVKATTTETLGFTGRNEGIACMASVLIQNDI